MWYLALVMKLAVILIGLCMMYQNQAVMSSPPFMSGFALLLIGLYLQLFVKSCTCGIDKSDKKKDKKKDEKEKKDKKKKKNKYDGNY